MKIEKGKDNFLLMACNQSYCKQSVLDNKLLNIGLSVFISSSSTSAFASSNLREMCYLSSKAFSTSTLASLIVCFSTLIVFSMLEIGSFKGSTLSLHFSTTSIILATWLSLTYTLDFKLSISSTKEASMIDAKLLISC